MAAVLALLVGTLAAGPVRAEEVVEVPTRPGQVVRALLIAPPSAKGAVILLAGGHGNLRLSRDGAIGWGRRNLLVRSRGLFADAGYVTLVPDMAADLEGTPLYRATLAHAQDIGFLVRHLRSMAGSVYLVGISRAALSVAKAASRLAGAAAPDAIVIASGQLMHVDRSQPSVETDIPQIARIRQPTLLVAHRQDVCAYSMPSSAAGFRALLTGAQRADVAVLSGGLSGDGEPCGPDSAHGFLGMDGEVVDAITRWLEALPPR
ncbi:MAG TPA: hypothetical protein VFA64_06915 [Hyphomicrobiaceae bacterium]|nr:hypothetical protein [Hyphomicrobiaceae bacterium]